MDGLLDDLNGSTSLLLCRIDGVVDHFGVELSSVATPAALRAFTKSP